MRASAKGWKGFEDHVVQVAWKSKNSFHSTTQGSLRVVPLQGRHNDRDGNLNPRGIDCLLNGSLVYAQINENIKAKHHWSFKEESVGDLCIPLTKVQ